MRFRIDLQGADPTPLSRRTKPRWSAGPLAADLVVVAIAAALLIVGIAANQQWLDRHFLPSFLLPRRWYVRIETTIRVLLAMAGLLLGFAARPRVVRFATRSPSRALGIGLAAVLAFGASEPVLRQARLRPTERQSTHDEPWRQPDQRLGWTLVPARTGRATIGGRSVEYAVDSAGYRVRRLDQAVDPDQPTILFTGESVMFGEGLTWEESVPAQVGAMVETQTANLAVHGFGNDQQYLRLQTEMPRFRRPVAVVSLFMTSLFGRNLESERPHLGPGLQWLPPVTRWRLESLARTLVFYHSEDVIARGVAVTREVFQATVDLALAHGATPLIVVPQFGHEEEAEQTLRRRLFDGSGVPYVLIEIDPTWHLPWNRHPDARAARAIATAIAARLREQLATSRGRRRFTYSTATEGNELRIRSSERQ